MNFYKAVINFFIKFLESNLSKCTVPRFNIYFSWKYNRDSVDFKETPPGKILLGKCLELGAFFHGRNKFF